MKANNNGSQRTHQQTKYRNTKNPFNGSVDLTQILQATPTPKINTVTLMIITIIEYASFVEKRRDPTNITAANKLWTK